MSKVISFASDAEHKAEILRMMRDDSNFAAEMSSILSGVRHPSINVDNVYAMRVDTQLLRVGDKISITDNFVMGREGESYDNHFLRIYGGMTRARINDLNVDNLYIQGRKINLFEQHTVNFVQDQFPSWS